MTRKLPSIDCQNLAFSHYLARDRMQRAQQLLGVNVVQRFLCFALYLLGVNRSAIGQALGIPAETAKSIIKAMTNDGLCALEDRRRSMSTFLPQSRPQPAPITLQQADERIVVDFGVEGRQLVIPSQNVLQIRAVLLSMLNSGLLSNHQVAEVIGLTPTHTATLAHRLQHEDISSLIDKRQGQKADYRVTPEVKAELVQQFVVDAIAHGKVSSEAISAELKERCQMTVPARTVRHHLARIGLPAIKHTLPKLLAAAKKKLRGLILNMQDRLPSGSQTEFGAVVTRIQPRVALRAAVVTLHIAGITARSASVFTETHVRTVHRWVFRMQGGHPLTDMPRCGRPRLFSESKRLMTIAVYCQKCPPLPGVYRWSLRDAHRYFKEHPECVGGSISRATIQRILAEHVLKPHRSKYYLQITDPDFFPKMEHIIDCYLHPPEYLYCYDECTCIQALERLTPNLPTTEHQPVLEDFDYRRNGITDLLAFLNPATGKVYARCTSNHDRHVFCRFFKDHVRAHPPEAVLHYIMDNLSTHYHDDFCQTVAELCAVPYSPLKSGAERRQWLQSEHKRIVVHFVPFHASWLNMVEIWFGILKGKCLKYDHFRSVEQLREAIRAFVETWNDFFAHPFTWSYTGEGLHAKAVRRFCTLLAIQTDQMDCKFLISQLLLMSNIADNSRDLIPAGDWLRLTNLAVEKDSYITNIIDTDTKPRRRKKAREAYDRFAQRVIAQKQSLAQTA